MKTSTLATLLMTFAAAMSQGCATGSDGGCAAVGSSTIGTTSDGTTICGSVPVTQNTGSDSCPSTGGGDLPAKCCTNGALPSNGLPLATGCPGTIPGPPPGGASIASAITATSDPIKRGLAEATAAKLTLSDVPPPLLSVTPVAATAGAVASAGSTLAQSNANGTSGTSSTTTPGGSSLAGAGNSGSGFTAAGLSTAPAPSGSGGTTNGSGLTPSTDGSGIYTQGNAAAATAGGYGAGNASLSSGLATTGENDVAQADMNGTGGSAGAKNGADSATANSDDPSDYFNRLGMGENIFKVVERRYTSKARQWINADLGNKLEASRPK